MPRKRISKPSEATTTPSCRHHWIIEFTEEPTSKGVCRLCGAEKVFENHVSFPAKGAERSGEANARSSTERDFTVVGRRSGSN
jgi:hypothetical protein